MKGTKLFAIGGSIVAAVLLVREVGRSSYKNLWGNSNRPDWPGIGEFTWQTVNGKWGLMVECVAPNPGASGEISTHAYTRDELMPDVHPGEVWEWKADVLPVAIATGGSVKLGVNWVFADGHQTSAYYKPISTAGDWQTIIVEKQVPEDVVKFRIHLIGSKIGSKGFFANISWRKIAPANLE